MALVPATFIASPAHATVISNLTISSPVVNEGGTASFTVTYSGSAASANNIVFTTSAGTATGGGTDYTTVPTVPGGTGSPATTIAAGAFPGTTAGGSANTIVVTVPTTADSSAEGPETFNLVATEANTGYVTSATATIADTKVNNLTVSPAGVWEGGTASFTVTYTGTTSSGSIAFGTVGSAETPSLTATKGTDFTGTPSIASYTFPGTAAGGTNTITVTVDTTADSPGEGADETFQLTATGASGTSTGTGTIWEPDATNDIVLGGATTVAETATSGTQKTVTITATSTNPAPHDVTIPVQTADFAGTSYATDMATSQGGANRDYTALAADAVITIPANETSGTATVTLWDDNSDETDTQYFVVKKDASRPTLGGAVVSAQSSVKIGIKDDDAVPVATIGDAPTAVEGSRLIFPVNLTNPSEKGVPLDIAVAGDTLGGTASAAIVGSTDNGSTTDVVAAASSVTVAKYATSTNLSLTTTTNPTGPSAFEGPEGVKVTISEPVSGATSTLGTKSTATGVVTDAGAGKTLVYSKNTPNGTDSPTNRTFAEGNVGSSDKKIYIHFDTNSPQDAVLNYTFVDGTAKNGVDYKGAAGTVTVPKDATKDVAIPVTIIGDTNAEPDETFKLSLTSPSGVVDESSLGEQSFTIDDDDAAPTWTTADVKVQEGNSGSTLARVPVTLSGPAAVDLVFDATYAPAGSATYQGSGAGSNDFDHPSATSVTIKAGDTVGYFDLPVYGDEVYERDETFNVTFASNAGNSTNVTTSTDVTQKVARVTIANDDAMPKLTFAQGTVTEGGSIAVTGTVVGISQYTYHIGFSVGGGATDPATAGADYKAADALATFDAEIRPGEKGLLTTGGGNFAAQSGGYSAPAIDILNDDIDEPTETLVITASEITPIPMGFAPSSTTVKIADDPMDLPPAVSIADATVSENAGNAEIPVNLTFTGDATSTVQDTTIPYYTADGTAKVGKDYTLTKGTLTIRAGDMKGTIKVPVINDRDMEDDETFSVRLGNVGPFGSSVVNGDATVTIKSDDKTPAVTPTLSASGPAKGAGAVTLTGKAAPNTYVELWASALPTTDPTKMSFWERVKSDGSGNFKFVTKSLAQGYAFVARSQEINSKTVTVKLTQNPGLTLGSTKGKLSVIVYGNPKATGQTVTVQRLVGGKWTTIGSGKTTASGYRTSVSIKSKTKVSVRALVSGNSSTGIASGYSATKTITIK
ncbi:hypothetical protein BJY16_000070 [Actinoplanes octamycinicus]|uniref:Calx-beta domain-containing protein n=1 Tax=Actinoplanes octamycinicus TaxID=135948 RepID=A0A7W7GQS4_9ACTN|nr:Calx-beta domain-containing protein [Actinoplanes octamycinicus]MBB4736611.1 hypothetical protein [Actinoplanes octamycinicus]